MIKVLQIGMSYAFGGIEKFIMEHYRAIDSEFSFDFISMFDKIACEEEIKELGGTIYPVINAKKNPVLCCKQIKDIINQNGYDAVHIHLASFSNPVPLLAASLSNCKNIILHSHNNGMSTGLRRFICHNISKLTTSKMKLERLACSKSAGEFMFKKAPFTVFENAIAKEKLCYMQEQRNQMRQLLGIRESSFVIGNVGRLDPQKNQSFLIENFYEYVKINPDSYLLIVGDGVLKQSLQALSYQLGIDSKVIFTGFQDDVSPYYQAMDVFCLPSIYEGLGIVGIEAQVNGLPCIFSDRCAKEVDVSGKSVFLSLDEKDRWIHMMHMQYLTRNLNARNTQIDGYDIKENVKKLEKLYSKRN